MTWLPNYLESEWVTMSKETFYHDSTWWLLGHFEPLLTRKLIMSSNLDIFEAPV